MREYGSRPERLIASVGAHTASPKMVIDGIRKLPRLLDAVHLLIERKGAHRFILTGCSVRKLRREGTNLELASVLNLANVVRESRINRKTLENCLQNLEDLLLGFRLEVFTKRVKRELAGHPKFYFFDTGIPRQPAAWATGLAGRAGRRGARGAGGPASASLVRLHAPTGQLHYWHTHTGVGVDFIVYGESDLFALKVENAARVRPGDLRGLKAFAQDYPQSRRYFFTGATAFEARMAALRARVADAAQIPPVPM